MKACNVFIRSLIKKLIILIWPKGFYHLRAARFKRTLPTEFVSCLESLDQNSLFIDVGANIGLVSELAARRGAKVYSFEPHPDALKGLQDVALRYTKIKVFEGAAGLTDGQAELYLHINAGSVGEDLTQASSLLSDKPNVSKDQKVLVPLFDLAKIIRGTDQFINIIKVDIEGYEVELIPHLIRSIDAAKVGKIFVETHDSKWPALREKTLAMERLAKNSDFANVIKFDWI